MSRDYRLYLSGKLTLDEYRATHGLSPYAKSVTATGKVKRTKKRSPKRK